METLSKVNNLQITLSPLEDSASLNWDPVDGAVEYRIWKRIGTGVFEQLTKTSETTYVDNAIVNNEDYSYYIQAIGEDESFTISYNEKFQAFESFYDFHPSIYINKGFRLLSTEPGLNQLWEHEAGNYNSFYGQLFPSEIILQVNPDEQDCIYNNVEFESEVYKDGIDVHNKTVTDIRCWNEYQDSTVKPLINNSNISRHFRKWKAHIPREIKDGNPTLNRIRSQWAKLMLRFDNQDNNKLVLHDIIVSYTAYPN